MINDAGKHEVKGRVYNARKLKVFAMKGLAEQIGDIDGVNIYGRVVGVRGLMVEIAGPIHAMSVGARIVIETGGDRFIPARWSASPATMPWSCRSPALMGYGAAAAP